MTKRVLVPLDRTDDAEEALKFIPELCDKADEIVLLSIAEPVGRMQTGTRPGRIVHGRQPTSPPGVGITGTLWPDVPMYAETKDQTIQRQLDELEGYLRPRAKALEEQGYEVSMAFEISDDPAAAIVDVARQTKPTFIIMVKTTHPGIGGRLFGTVAQNVIRENVSPVMILPSHA